jgi:[protein-PII] uridylyltransferase
MTIDDVQEQLVARLESGETTVTLLKEALGEIDTQLAALYREQRPIRELVNGRARLVDTVLLHLWADRVGEQHAALVAVGGYGRAELHPASDIDLLILVPQERDEFLAETLSGLITLLWDIGLQVGQSVRSVAECIDHAREDISIATNLLEARHLAGDRSLFDAMIKGTSPDRIWPTDVFFAAKMQEQKERHQKYDDTAHNLEPNIKEGPGGLRDIQMIGWIAKRYFGTETFRALIDHGFLTEAEYRALVVGEEHLWKIRFALHILTGREEDRILFDYQRTLADQFGYETDEASLNVEKFMQKYYRTVTRLQRLNDMLLQHFEETIVLRDKLDPPCVLNKRFQTINGYLEVIDKQLFSHRPVAMLELFLLMAQHPDEIRGVRASTIRLIYQHLKLIDRHFRNDHKARRLFIEILSQPRGVTHVLRLMNRYGILAYYIPAFANIVGRMQYDLFHVYTVDTHTLFLVRNLRRFTVEKYRHEFPLCSAIMESIGKQELLMIAALFHDIAKGRGGDHSELGAIDALDFCRRHDIPEEDAQLVAWIVRHHLVMSMTAQRKDIEDPAVIAEFAGMVGDRRHLDHLFLLTNADMRATNPKRWNSWKGSLLDQLYNATAHALDNRQQEIRYMLEQIEQKQLQALEKLEIDWPREEIIALWATLSSDYFQQNSAEEIVWHTDILFRHPAERPLVRVRGNASHGGSEVLVIDEDRDDLFAITTWVLDHLGLNTLHARIETSDTKTTINSFIVLEENGEPIADGMRMEEVQQRLTESLMTIDHIPATATRRIPRQLRHFDIETRIGFSQDTANHRTVLHLETADRPGLLALIGLVFSECGIRLMNAKVATIGEQVDDSFYVLDRHDEQIEDEALQGRIRERLLHYLDKSYE